jgi:hypothetical protein
MVSRFFPALPAALAVAISLSASAQQVATTEPPPSHAHAEVLVLGTYHMANPGHDIFNMKADDVLAPKRQAEMAELIEVLKKFHPTKIAIESDAGTEKIPKRYADYLAGKYELTANEIDQIGLRLAKELGHKTVYPVDADGDFPYQRLVNYAKGSGRSKELDAVNSVFAANVKEQGDYLASHSILETLVLINSDQRATQEVGLYYRMAAIGEPQDWAGADLIADWFRRNVRIYSNVLKLVDSPNERVLVIFGAGHLGWLQQDFASSPELRLRKLSDFAK